LRSKGIPRFRWNEKNPAAIFHFNPIVKLSLTFLFKHSTIHHMRFFLAVFLLVLSLAHASAQTCNYLAYESFSYNANLPLHGLQGGTGWAAPWEVQVGNTSIPGYQTSSGSAMTYQDLQTLGNYETGSYQYLSAGRNFNLSSSGPFQPWLNGQGAIGQAGTTLWASILLRKTANNNETSAAYWHPSNINWCWNCSTARIGVGYFGEPSNDPNSGILLVIVSE
jgi:hypothetical protein